MTRAWIGNWYERVKNRVHERGFPTVTAFAECHPTMSLLALADLLGDDVAAAQLERILVLEAEESGTIETVARSLLVRSIHEHLPEGWHEEWDPTPLSSGFRLASVYGNWCSPLSHRYEAHCDRVWEVLAKTPIPEGWLPSGPDDPILVELFKHWNEPTEAAKAEPEPAEPTPPAESSTK